MTISSTRWRIHTTDTNGGGWTHLVSLAMHTSIGGSDVCSGGTASASYINSSGESAAKAFDNDLTTHWWSGNGDGSKNNWVEYAFASSVSIVEYAITGNSSSQNYPSDCPKAWTFEVWDGSQWLVVDTQSNQTSWGTSETRTFSFSTATVNVELNQTLVEVLSSGMQPIEVLQTFVEVLSSNTAPPVPPSANCTITAISGTAVMTQTHNLTADGSTITALSSAAAITIGSHDVVHTRILALLATNPRITPIALVLDASTPITGYSPGGATVGELSQTAAAASAASGNLGDKLNKAAADTLSGVIGITGGGGFVAGTLTWDASGNVTGGYGTAMTPKGLVGYDGTHFTFAIDPAGNAVFRGDISGSSGTFEGNLTAGGTVNVSGFVRATGNMAVSDFLSGYYATIQGSPSDSGTNGVIGQSHGSASGVVGSNDGTGAGVTGVGTANSYGVMATNWGSGIAFYCAGRMVKDGTELVSNLRAEYAQNLWSPNATQKVSLSNSGIVTGNKLAIVVNGVTKYIQLTDS